MNKPNALFSLLSLFLFSFTIKDEGTQRAYYECKNPLSVDQKLFEVQPGKVYFSFHQALKPMDLKDKGFMWLESKPKGYFTAYLINTTDSVLHVPKQDGSLIMIQEALNEQGEWAPIEYWVSSGCGDSYHNLSLAPSNYVMIPIKQYKGSYKTKIRLKMRQKGRTNFYSEPFEARIDKSQFQKEVKEVSGVLYDGPPNYLDN